jgi:hypothetical protein
MKLKLNFSNKVPLSSDAFTGFSSEDDAGRVEHMKDVTEATRRLLKDVIPAFARDLNKHEVTPVDHRELIDMMHKRGINVKSFL